ncbi:MAG: hypothetical protein ACTSRY_00020 [Alphaproteobacteria bacterium]
MAGRIARPCPVLHSTPEDAQHIFGFHDLCPWDADDRALALLRIPRPPAGIPGAEDIAEIVLWDPVAGATRKLGETTAWNWQQGARMQWLPGATDVLIHNARIDGRLVAIRREIATGAADPLPFTVYSLSPDGKRALSPNFARLHAHWRPYGYAGGSAPDANAPIPAGDGLYLLDMDSGRVDLLISIADLASFRGDGLQTTLPQFVSHPTFSPSGKRICFFHRFFTPEGALYTRLIAAEADGSGLRLLAEESCSHFDWLDDDTIVAWARRLPSGLAAARRRGWLASPLLRPAIRLARNLKPGLKQQLLGQSYLRLSVAGAAPPEPVGRGILDEDGHPQFSTDRRWMLTDTYADSGRTQTLILYDMTAGDRYDIGGFHAPPALTGDLKCDLHPRWNRANRLICIDSAHLGTRQVHIVDAGPVLDAA